MKESAPEFKEVSHRTFSLPPKKERHGTHKFRIGDKAVLTCPTIFKVGQDEFLVEKGEEVEIIDILSDCGLYDTKYGQTTSLLNGAQLMPVSQVVFKFTVGDKVALKEGIKIRTVTDRFIVGKDCPAYELDGYLNVWEDEIELDVFPDITEHIKTFEDAEKWCNENGFHKLTDALTPTIQSTCEADIIAYLKLRIITAALNEGWEPNENDCRYTSCYRESNIPEFTAAIDGCYCDSALKLCFKSSDLAAYATSQFRNIYADFCGCAKGGEK